MERNARAVHFLDQDALFLQFHNGIVDCILISCKNQEITEPSSDVQSVSPEIVTESLELWQAATTSSGNLLLVSSQVKATAAMAPLQRLSSKMICPLNPKWMSQKLWRHLGEHHLRYAQSIASSRVKQPSA